MELNKKELNEPINVTIGRLRIAIQDGKTERSLELLEKISSEVVELGVKYPEILCHTKTR
jgi:hypothetical protein